MLCFLGQSPVGLWWEKNETNLFSYYQILFRLLVEALKHNNCHFLCSCDSITMETAAKHGSDSEYVMTQRQGRNVTSILYPRPYPQRYKKCLGDCVCYEDYGIGLICNADQKTEEMSPSKIIWPQSFSREIFVFIHWKCHLPENLMLNIACITRWTSRVTHQILATSQTGGSRSPLAPCTNPPHSGTASPG